MKDKISIKEKRDVEMLREIVKPTSNFIMYIYQKSILIVKLKL